MTIMNLNAPYIALKYVNYKVTIKEKLTFTIIDLNWPLASDSASYIYIYYFFIFFLF